MQCNLYIEYYMYNLFVYIIYVRIYIHICIYICTYMYIYTLFLSCNFDARHKESCHFALLTHRHPPKLEHGTQVSIGETQTAVAQDSHMINT